MANKDEILKKKAQYRETHKEAMKAKDKRYYEEHKQDKYDCPCGSSLRCDNKWQHERTKKHIDFINKAVEPPEPPSPRNNCYHAYIYKKR